MADTSSSQADSGWQYKPSDTVAPKATMAAGPEAVSTASPSQGRSKGVTWTASEFIAHHKSVGWYVFLLVIGAVLCGLIYLTTKDMITVTAIAACFLIFGVAAARKPRVLAYRLDETGLTVGQRLYPYANFKAFALVDEGSFTSIAFVPLKRFSPPLSIYFAPEDEHEIVAVLSQYLPLEQGQLDLFESLMRRIRF